MGRKKLTQTSQSERVKHKLIGQSSITANVSAYVILTPDPDRYHVATIHILYPRRGGMRLDVFQKERLIHQYTGNCEDYPFSRALNGVELADIRLFDEEVRIISAVTAISRWEPKTYLPGLDRLKALGYHVIKAI